MTHARVASVPPPGAIVLTRISGLLGVAVHIGQWANGDLSAFTHAAVHLGDGRIVEAEPGGAIESSIDQYRDGRPLLIAWPSGWGNGTPGPGAPVAAAARGLVGVPYGFWDYASLTLARLRIRLPWVRDRVANRGEMICSQLVDEAYRRAGVHLFTDGRLSGDVTPGDLARLVSSGPSWTRST